MKLNYIILISLLIIGSCQKDSKNLDKQSILIQVDNIKISLTENLSAIVIDTLIDKKLTTIRKEIRLSQIEKAKIFEFANKAMAIKKYTIKTQTCFAGHNFKFVLARNSDSLKIENPSVKEWTSIFPEFEQIQVILNRKVKVPK
jgi:hypothetical protein